MIHVRKLIFAGLLATPCVVTAGAVLAQSSKGETKVAAKAKAAAPAAKQAAVAPPPFEGPKPVKATNAEESRSNARYDAAIAAVRDRTVSPDTAQRLREALAKAGAETPPAPARTSRRPTTLSPSPS